MHIDFFWIYDLPNYLFGLICVLFFVAFGLVGLWLTRAHARRIHRIQHSHNDVVSYFLAAITVLYGITLGLVTIGTWTTFSEVESRVSIEAEVIGSLYHDLEAYKSPLRETLQQDLRDYVRTVIDIGWPQQRKGIVTNASDAPLRTFQRDFVAFEPQNMQQQIVHTEAFKQLNRLIEMRRARLNTVSAGLPMSLWVVVILGAFATIATTWFFDLASIPMHAFMTVLLAGLLGMMIFLIATLDNPFRGQVSVTPEPLEMVYRQTMQP